MGFGPKRKCRNESPFGLGQGVHAKKGIIISEEELKQEI